MREARVSFRIFNEERRNNASDNSSSAWGSSRTCLICCKTMPEPPLPEFLFFFVFVLFGFAVSWPWVSGFSYLALFACPLQNSLLDGALANQSVDGHLFCLAQTMGSIHGLLVDSGIPIRIVEDNLQVLKIKDIFTSVCYSYTRIEIQIWYVNSYPTRTSFRYPFDIVVFVGHA